MSYAFSYFDKNTIYLEVGFNSKEEAKKGLENIVSIYCKTKKYFATGQIDEVKNKEIKVLETLTFSRKI